MCVKSLIYIITKNDLVKIIYTKTKKINNNMVTKVEVNGYEIVIEEKDGVISVSAMKDDEVIEEFELETEEGQDDDVQGGEVQGFDEFGQDEEDDFDAQDDEEGQDDEDFDAQDDEDFDAQDDEEGQDDEDLDDEKVEGQLESFQSFINKRKK